MKEPRPTEPEVLRDVERAFRMKAAALQAKHALARIVAGPPAPRPVNPPTKLRLL